MSALPRIATAKADSPLFARVRRHSEVAGKIGNVPGRIFHLWHGNFINRNSRGRQRLLAGFDYDPDLDLRIGPNGAWHWARPRPDLEDFLKSYFVSRAEDE